MERCVRSEQCLGRAGPGMGYVRPFPQTVPIPAPEHRLRRYHQKHRDGERRQEHKVHQHIQETDRQMRLSLRMNVERQRTKKVQPKIGEKDDEDNPCSAHGGTPGKSFK